MNKTAIVTSQAEFARALQNPRVREIVIQDNAVIVRVADNNGKDIFAGDNARVFVSGSAKVTALSNSNIEASEAARVTAWERSHVQAWGNARIVAHDNARGWVSQLANCIVMDNSARIQNYGLGSVQRGK